MSIQKHKRNVIKTSLFPKVAIILVLLTGFAEKCKTNLTPANKTTPTVETPSVSASVPMRLQAGSIPLYASADYPQSPDSSLDLDTGLSWQDTIQADIKFSISNNLHYFLHPVNGAWASSVGTNEPGFNGCKQIINALSPDPIGNLNVGVYVCLLTNQGHLAQVQVEKLHNLGEGSIRLSFITWNEAFEDSVEHLATIYPTTVTPIMPPPTKLPPTSTPGPETPILRTGFVRLQTDWPVTNVASSFLDLENIRPINEMEADIQFVVSRGGGGMYFSYLLPINDAKADAIGMIEPGLSGCQETMPNLSMVSVHNIGIGMYLCAISNEGHLAQLHIENANFTEGWIEVSFLTWDADGITNGTVPSK